LTQPNPWVDFFSSLRSPPKSGLEASTPNPFSEQSPLLDTELRRPAGPVANCAAAGYLEAGEIWAGVWYLNVMLNFELWQNGNDGLGCESADLAPDRLDVVAESLQSPKHAAYCPLRAVLLRPPITHRFNASFTHMY